MNCEGINAAAEVLKHLAVDEQLPRRRILDRKLAVFGQAPKEPLVSVAQAGKISIPKLLDRGVDMATANAVFTVAISLFG